MLKRYAIALPVAALFGAILAAQQPPLPAGTASISGTVAAAGANTPIAGATVEIRRTDCNSFGNPADVLSVVTGADGRFTINRVRAGNWCIVATAPGGRYTPAEYLQRGVLGRGLAIPVADGQAVTGIQLAMVPTGGITGRVLDYDGEPRAFTRVQVMHSFHQEGERRLYILQVTQTNDRGEYRFYWLPPGSYYLAAAPEDTRRQQVVSVQPPPGMGGRREDVLPPVVVSRISPRGDLTEETFAVVYYPGETQSRLARAIEVPPGSIVGPVDLSLNAGKMRSFRVRGTVINGLTGMVAGGAQIRLAPQEWTATVLMPTATVDALGNFELRGVLPGAYVLYANQTVPNPAAPPPPPPGAPQPAPVPGAPPPPPPIPLSARFVVNVGGGDVENLKLVMVQGTPVTGKVVVDGAPGAEIPRGITVMLARQPDLVGIPASQGRGAVQTDGTFTLPNVGPGEYRLYVPPFLTPFQWSLPAMPQQLQGGYLKAIRIGGRDVMAEGLVVTENGSPGEIQIVLGRGGQLTGLALNERREPVTNATVALVPDLNLRRRSDLYRSATTDRDGRFQLQGIAPGNYRVFVWEVVERDLWQNNDFLRTVESRGTPVEIREGAAANVEVVAIP